MPNYSNFDQYGLNPFRSEHKQLVALAEANQIDAGGIELLQQTEDKESNFEATVYSARPKDGHKYMTSMTGANGQEIPTNDVFSDFVTGWDGSETVSAFLKRREETYVETNKASPLAMNAAQAQLTRRLNEGPK